jgi:hypothetical protein
MDSFEVLRKTISPTGAKSVASEMNLSTSIVYKWCAKRTESNSGAENPLDRIVKICKATGEHHPIAWLCQQFGGFFVKNPPQAKLQNTPVLRVTQVILKEFSEVLDAVSLGLDNDGQIDIEEAKRIRCEWETLKAATEGFVVSCEHGVYVESEQD